MDPQSSTFTPQSDIWSLSNSMRNIQEIQQEHAERLIRLERRQEEQARVRSVWGTSSPFPGVLSGTPQHGPTRHPSGVDFANFDDDQSTNMIRSLHLDTEDEPRRLGTTSRANSVRFDESANQNQWSHVSRPSMDQNSRTSSGFGVIPGLGGHSLFERSSSQKSDGRHSSTGHSISGRANSLGLDSSLPLGQSTVPSLPPGFFILGSVPSIIRCWLDTNFKHESLLYAAICTGSYKSFLDARMIRDLGFQDQVRQDINGDYKIKIPVYLPEAIAGSSTSRSSSPVPQLPNLTVDFTVVSNEDSMSKAIQIFLGSDTLRAHNADILFSSNTLSLFDDDRTKLSIPLVRPENDLTFKSLYITSGSSSRSRSRSGIRESNGAALKPAALLGPKEPPEASHMSDDFTTAPSQPPIGSSAPTHVDATSGNDPPRSHDPGHGEGSVVQEGTQNHDRKPSLTSLRTSNNDTKDVPDSSPTLNSASRTVSSPAIWNNWRRDTGPSSAQGQSDWATVSRSPGNTTYSRPTRDSGIKVLKPTRQASRSSNVPPATSPTVAGQSRFFDDAKRRTATESDSGDSSGQPRRSTSIEAGPKAQSGAAVPKKSSNPVGGASAFGWLNSGQGK